MADDADKKDWKMEFHPDFFRDLTKISQDDPEAADAVREMLANMRQAMEGVNTGKYENFEDAMEAITGQRPVQVGTIEEDDADDTTI